MKRKVFLCLVALIMSVAGCAKKTTFVLVPDPDGNTGTIEVSTAAGSQIVNQPGQYVEVKGPEDPPSSPKPMAPEKIQKMFGAALAAEPEPPAKFILYFNSGAAALTEASKALLPKIVSTIKDRGSDDISVTGHSDSTGSEIYNLVLSVQRTQAVMDYLVSHDIPSQYIQTASHGEGNPLVPTPDGVPEPRNRRVEVIVR